MITSDEGTVNSGAATALGVEEKQIGLEGGELAAKVLKGQPISQLPIQSMSQLLVFINTKAAAAQGLNVEAITNYAKQQNFGILLYPEITTNCMDIIITSLSQSMLFLPLALGIYISYVVLRATDLTVDGSFVLGAAIFARLVVAGVPIGLAFLAAGAGNIGRYWR